jgi:hypothetical protein
MASPLIDWPRPHFRAGRGDAFLFYVVYGQMPQELAISRSKYRCDGIPDGMTLMRYGPSVHAEVVDSYREGYVWDHFSRNRPSLAADVKRQTECLVIAGSVADPADLNYFRNIVGLITWGFDGGGVALYDPQTFTWWDSSEWRSRVFEPARASPMDHVTILVSEDGEGSEWIHTRGMRKFGRPDLSIHRVSSEYRDAVLDLCNRFIEFQALGGVIAEREEIKMRALPAGMICWHRGDSDDPDFNNVHVEVTWPE